MEARKITIVSTTNAQTKKVIMSSATTLGELKGDLDAAGVQYDNMDFFEGVSKTKLINNDSVLPTNIPYKGENTNELVFMLTTSRKKIESGFDRSVTYELKKAVENYFDANILNVSAEDLEYVLEELQNLSDMDSLEMESREARAIEHMTQVLYGYDILEYQDLKDIQNILNQESVREEGIPSSYDDEDIDDMINSIL